MRQAIFALPPTPAHKVQTMAKRNATPTTAATPAPATPAPVKPKNGKARRAAKQAAATAAPATPAPATPNLVAAYQAATAAPATPARAGGGSGWPLASTLQVLHTNHGCKPGSRRAAIMAAVLACLQGGGTVQAALAIARPMQGGPEDLRILASKGCIAAPAGVATATRAALAKQAATPAVA